MARPLLEVRDLTIEFATRQGRVHAIDGVSFAVKPSEMLGIVGESGSGKSVSAYAVLGLLDNSALITGGEAYFEGVDLLRTKPEKLRRLRGSSVSMIFQNPRTALISIRTVGDQLTDVIMAHQSLGRKAARGVALDTLRAVKITDPVRRLDAYPFELSGGMCQRIMIALALVCSPRLLIADEPTTGLDVTTQAAIMDLIDDLRRTHGMGVIFITHDLALASDYCDRISVMHAGQVVETSATEQLFEKPGHPYTRSLMAASVGAGRTVEELVPVPGSMPDLRASNLPPCRFSRRCTEYDPQCDLDRPPLRTNTSGHSVACWRRT